MVPGAPPGAAPGAPAAPPKDVFDRAIQETSQAAQELLDASKRVAEAIARRARGETTPEVSGRARKALHVVADELRHAGKEIEKALDDLK